MDIAKILGQKGVKVGTSQNHSGSNHRHLLFAQECEALGAECISHLPPEFLCVERERVIMFWPQDCIPGDAVKSFMNNLVAEVARRVRPVFELAVFVTNDKGKSFMDFVQSLLGWGDDLGPSSSDWEEFLTRVVDVNQRSTNPPSSAGGVWGSNTNHAWYKTSRGRTFTLLGDSKGVVAEYPGGSEELHSWGVHAFGEPSFVRRAPKVAPAEVIHAFQNVNLHHGSSFSPRGEMVHDTMGTIELW